MEKKGKSIRFEMLIASSIILLGAIMFSTKAIMVKLAYRYEVDHLSLLLLRMIFALPFYIVIYFYFNRSQVAPKINRKDVVWTAAFGILGYYLASLFDFKGLLYIPAGLERVILFLYPTLVLMISRIFFGKQIQKVQIAAIILSYIGVAIAFLGDAQFDGSYEYFMGGGWILLSSITYAAYLVGSGWILPRVGTFRFTSLAMIFATVYLCLHYLFVHINSNTLLDFHPYVYGYALAMAIFATVVPSFLISEGIKRIGANNAAIIGGIGPISTIVLAYFFLGEGFSYAQMLGTVLVIGGVLTISLLGKK